MSTNGPEIRELTLDEIDAVGGGAKSYDFGFGITLTLDGKCWSVTQEPTKELTQFGGLLGPDRSGCGK